MPYSKTQLNRIMAKRGQAFVPKSKLPYAGRVCETYIRKKIYRLEDRAALAAFRLFQTAYTDIRNQAYDLAGYAGLKALDMGSAATDWRHSVAEYAGQRLDRLAQDVAYSAFQYASTAYRAGYYGRVWLLDQSSPADFRPNFTQLPAEVVSSGVLTPLAEAYTPTDGITYAVKGADWRQGFQNIMAGTRVKMARALSTAAVNGATIPAAVTTAIGLPMGMGSKPNAKTAAAYHETQSTIRADVMRASNHGAVRAYQDNSKVILGVIFLSSHDSKVCFRCERLDGKIWILNDLLGIALAGLPPDGTHRGCRCGVAPILLPGWGDSGEPPGDTFEDWWDDEIGTNEMDDFFADDRLESSMV